MVPIPFLQIDFSPSSKVSFDRSRSGETSPSLRVGEILEGRVMELFDDTHGLIRVKGQDLSMTSHFPLLKGMERRFRVETVEPQVILKVLPEEAEGIPPVRALLTPLFGESSPADFGKALSVLSGMNDEGGEEVRSAFIRLQGLLECFSPEAFPTPDPKILKQMLAGSGLFLEGKMRALIQNPLEGQGEQILEGDLKALLMQLISLLESGPFARGIKEGASPEREDALTCFRQVLQKVEGYQVLNLHHSGDQEKAFLLIPLWFQNALHFGELALALPHRDPGRGDAERTDLLFILQLPDLGKMRIDVKVSEKNLFCSFHVHDEAVSELFQSHLPDLQERLIRLGFQSQLNVSVAAPEEMTQAFLQEVGTETEMDAFLNIVV